MSDDCSLHFTVAGMREELGFHTRTIMSHLELNTDIGQAESPISDHKNSELHTITLRYLP